MTLHGPGGVTATATGQVATDPVPDPVPAPDPIPDPVPPPVVEGGGVTDSGGPIVRIPPPRFSPAWRREVRRSMSEFRMDAARIRRESLSWTPLERVRVRRNMLRQHLGWANLHFLRRLQG